METRFFRLDVDERPFLACLDEEERTRAARFIFDEHRKRFTVGRGMLRQLVGERLGIAPGEVRFSTGEHGKPEVAGLHFNLSHSGDVALIAFSTEGPLGVDVEGVRPIDVEPVGQNVFSDGEMALLRSLGGDAQLAMFYRLWTLKEAYIKATGEGMYAPLRDITVELSANPIRFLDGRAGFRAMRGVLLDAPAGFMAAVAY